MPLPLPCLPAPSGSRLTSFRIPQLHNPPLLPSPRAAHALVSNGHLLEGPWGQTDGPRVLEPLRTVGVQLVGKGLVCGGCLSLYDRVGSPSPLGWFGRKVRCLGRWEEAGQARGTGVLPGEGEVGQTGSSEQRPSQGHGFGLGRGWGSAFPSARHRDQWGFRLMGRKGSSLCLGLVTPEHLAPLPRPPFPRWPSRGGAWMGRGAGAKAPRVPSFSVFGAAQRKMFSRWEAPLHGSREPQGADLPAPSRSPQPCSGPQAAWPLSFWPPSGDTSWLCPLRQGVGDESANRGPPLGREAPGRGRRSRM